LLAEQIDVIIDVMSYPKCLLTL